MHNNRRFVFPTGWDLLLLFVIYALSQFVAVALVGGAYTLITHQGMETFMQSDVAIFCYYIVAMILALCAFALLAHKRQPHEKVDWIRSGKGSFRWPMALWGMVMFLALSVVIEPLLSSLPMPEIPIANSGWGLLMVVVAAPILEELMCRGFLFEHLRAKHSTVIAWLVSSIFFGVIHMNWLQGINAALIALIFCYIYIISGTLWSTIVLHAINNAVAFFLMCRGYNDLTLCQIVGDTTLYGIIYGAAVVVLGLSALCIYRTLKKIHQNEKMSDPA